MTAPTPLTDEQKETIKARCKAGDTKKKLRIEFSVSDWRLNRILGLVEKTREQRSRERFKELQALQDAWNKATRAQQ